MNKSIPIVMIICAVVFDTWMFRPVFADHFSAGLGMIPMGADQNGKGDIVDLVKLWAKATGHDIDIQVYPFKRSLNYVRNGITDFHLPMIKNPYIDPKDLDYEYSTTAVTDVNFVLYTNKNKPIDTSDLSRYTITTAAAHAVMFDFPIGEDYTVESALKKLSTRRIDGYIFADMSTDPILRRLGFTNIRRQLYKTFKVHAILPKGGKGGPVDRMITEAMVKIKADGSYDKVIKPEFYQYSDWQP